MNVLEAKPPRISTYRMPYKTYISGDGFRAMADHVFDETDESLSASEIAYGDIIFVKTNLLGKFFEKIHPFISDPYILISHNADHGAPAEFEDYLNDPKILRWFAQNPTIRHHEKFEAIPIGIQNRYVCKDRLQNFVIFDEYRLQHKIEKNCLVGLNFVRSNWLPRQIAYDCFINRTYCHQILSENHLDYLMKMSRAKFIISPVGNGLDCHRTWEAIIVGAIPILISSQLDELLQDLPVCIVTDWHIVTEEFLEKMYTQIQENRKQSVIEKVTYDYWEQRIRDFQIKCRQNRQ